MCEVLVCLLKRSLFLKPLVLQKLNPPLHFRSLRQIGQKQISQIKNTANDWNYEKPKLDEKEIRTKLQSVLGIREFEALKLLSTNKMLLFTEESLILQNCQMCMDNNLHREVIFDNPFLLWERDLPKKISKLSYLPIDLSYSIPFAKLTMWRLNFIVLRKSETMEKIHTLCKLFDISVKKACDVLSNKPFLFTKPLDELEEKLDIFYDYGFTKEEVLKDLWIIKYSNESIRNRLNFIKDHDIKCLKTWMIRCQETTLYKHIKRVSDNRHILGKNSVAQYLSEKLDCSEAVAKSLIRKHPQLQNKSLLKMNVMIDMLYRQGFTPVQICKLPKILLHSTQTTEQRLKQLVALGMKPNNLYILTKSQKQYLQHVDNLVKVKTKVENV